MYAVVTLLLVGFGANLASAFTWSFSARWGRQTGQLASALLRNVLGIPVWGCGVALAATTFSARIIAPNAILDVVAWCLVGIGALVIIAALIPLGRRAFAPSAGDTLVHTGLYAYLRHPIHAGTLLEFVGMGMLMPTGPMLSACGMGVVWLVLQSRLEELDLLRRIPEYGEYMQQVPKLIPRRPRRKSGRMA